MTHDVSRLTERERQALRLLASGHDGKSIAAALDISIHTVNERLREARRKLGISSSREAARLLLASEGAAEAPQNLGHKEMWVGPAAPDDIQEAPGRLETLGRRPAILFVGLIMTIAVLAALVALQPSGTEQPVAPALLYEPRPQGSLSALFTGDDYPEAVTGARATGGVGFRLEISPSGRVANCEITRSSGNEAVDAATCRILKSRSRFVPAIDRAGHAVAAEYHGRVDWPRPG